MGFFDKLFGRSSPKCPFKKTEHSTGIRWDFYSGKNRSEALAVLRGLEIIEERHYAIVETPDGDFAKDFLMISDDRTHVMIEPAERKPLGRLQRSKTHCAKCGHSVVPAEETPGLPEVVIMDHMKNTGMGFWCESCETAWCGICVSLPDGSSSPVGSITSLSSKVPSPICKKSMEPFRDLESWLQ